MSGLKEWSAGDQVNASDLNSNFAFSREEVLTAGETLVATNAVFFKCPQKAISLTRASSMYLSLADTAALSITGDITLEAWVYLSSAPSAGQIYEIINKFTDSGSQASYFLAYHNNGGTPRLIFGASVSGGAPVEMRKNQTISTSTWTHIAINYTASTGTTEFFINGSSIGTDSGGPASIYDSTAPFCIGARFTPAIGGFFDGYITEVRVWNLKRTSTQIANNYNVELTGTETGLVGYWQFRNELYDYTGTTQTELTNNNGCTFVTSGPSLTGTGVVYKASAASHAKCDNFLGFVKTGVSAGSPVTIVWGGAYDGFPASLTTQSNYYLSNTAGSISTTPGTITKLVGVTLTTSKIIVWQR